MGTSKSNIGPSKNSPLLPPWAPEPPAPNAEPQNAEGDKENDDSKSAITAPESDNKENHNVIGNLSNARKNLSRFVQNPNKRSFNSAAKSYVESYGEGRKAAKTAISGKLTGGRFSGFLSNVANEGINKALEFLGLGNLIGKPVEFVLTKIADAIAPSGATNEEAAAREAILEALGFIYDSFELKEKDITELDSLDRSGMELAIKEYVSSYIFHRWLHELGRKIEEKSSSTRELVKIEKEAKEFIKSAVNLDLSKIDFMKIDMKSGQVKGIMNKIFDEAYILIETL